MNAWTTDDGQVLVRVSEDYTIYDILTLANDALESEGYLTYLTIYDVFDNYSVIWVDPWWVDVEDWPSEVVSSTPIPGWVEVWAFEAEGRS